MTKSLIFCLEFVAILRTEILIPFTFEVVELNGTYDKIVTQPIYICKNHIKVPQNFQSSTKIDLYF